MSRESLARATNSGNLEMEPDVIHDVDWLAAAATGNTLGGLLLRLREGAQPRWARRALLILTNRILDKQDKMTRSIAEKVAAAALGEFLQPHCVVCKGARVMMLGQVKITCDACGGTGLQRFSNASRREEIGTYGSRIDAAMTFALNEMNNALASYLGNAGGRLK